MVPDESVLNAPDVVDASSAGPPPAATQETEPASGYSLQTRGSLFDDDLPELAPLVQTALEADQAADRIRSLANQVGETSTGANTPRAKKKVGRSKPIVEPEQSLPNLEDFEDELKLAALDASPQKMPGGFQLESKDLANQLDKLSLPGSALDIDRTLKKEQEFGFSCKVCGTRMVIGLSKVGSKIRCDDCHSNIVVPPPAKKAVAPPTLTRSELADVSLLPSDGLSSRDVKTSRSQSYEMLEKAKKEVDAEEKELEAISSTFDTQKWLSLIFWFCRDPLLCFIAVLFGVFCAVWLALALNIGSIVQLGDSGVGVLQTILLLVPGAIVFAFLSGLAMCVLNMTGNLHRRVQDWPFANLGDFMGEVTVIGAAVAMAAAPGGLIGSIFARAMDLPILTHLTGLFSVWVLLPFILLSLIDNNSIVEPFSKNVFDSLREKVDAWGAMYLQTGLTVGSLFLLIALCRYNGLVGGVLMGLLLPALVLFLFNQYGLLAGRISDVTSLDYSGDFSENDETGGDE